MKIILTCLFSILTFVAVAQVPLQVNYITSSALSDSFDCAAVQETGDCFLFKAIVDSTTITIKRTIITPDGNVSQSETVFGYDNHHVWEGDAPILRNTQTKYGFTYMTLANSNYIYVIKIPDIAMNTVPTLKRFTNLEAYISPSFYIIFGSNSIYCYCGQNYSTHKLDLVTGLQTTVGFGSPILLGDEYLLISYSNTEINLCKIIDLDGNISSPIFNYASTTSFDPGYVSHDIGGSTYFIQWSPDLYQSGGYLTYQDNQISLTVLSTTTWGAVSIPLDVIPLAYHRFVCIEYNSSYNTAFHTYQFNNGGYVPDTDFPNLNLPEFEEYAEYLLNLNNRFIVGIMHRTWHFRKFVLIDRYFQHIVTTNYTHDVSISDGEWEVLHSEDHIFYLRQGDVDIYGIGSSQTGTIDTVSPATTITANAYPNPFNKNVSICINNCPRGKVDIRIYNLKGQLITTLSNPRKQSGGLEFKWDGLDSSGNPGASGMYLYKVIMPDREVISGKILLQK